MAAQDNSGAGALRSAAPVSDHGADVEGLREFYEAGYAEESELFARWRALGGAGKAGHVAALCRRAALEPRSVVDIGCGEGALLAELSRRGIGAVLDGFELSPTAVELARRRALPRGRRIEVYDGRHVPAEDGAYDLAVLSHVVEHVADPLPLLREARRVATHVLVEVPLEANRSAARPAKRTEAARIGHIQFFDRGAVRGLCETAGLEIRAELADPLVREHLAFGAAGARAHILAAMKAGVRRTAWRAAPGAAERSFTVHYACIAARRT
jgi:SAM-dependent methyltransferase